jgi:3-phenylpropionate/trans-cinnamate dioxygenase ferredoxin subunit
MTETLAGYTRVCALADLPEVGGIKVEAGATAILIARGSDGVVHALNDYCSHALVSLSEGDVYDNVVECWLHGAEFDLTTGEALTLPATEPVYVYNVKVDDESVYVDLSDINQES